MNKKQARKRPFYKKKRFIIPVLFLAFLVYAVQLSPNNSTEPPASVEHPKPTTTKIELIDDVTQYSRITEDELKAIMGEPISEENWNYQTSYRKVPVKTLVYDTDKVHYEFIISDNMVVRVTLYSSQYWYGKGTPFTYKNIKDIRRMFNIKPRFSAVTINNNVNYQIESVNDKIDDIRVAIINPETKTFDWIKITYDQRYFS